ncbi:hypothetical protein [Gracilibacillus alcaliphilus]|uniref:hypothetical protein n=1 Tax=Gracilibacillus alcaliphilus TaxID=1401441 RepID=UPI00195CA861|nr:hypothetical protein [Gracilibacillus alcaliphilus]MBM7679275.1 hypothetical protein [Gracilibacillus alcaliphilus]
MSSALESLHSFLIKKEDYGSLTLNKQQWDLSAGKESGADPFMDLLPILFFKWHTFKLKLA